MHAFKRVWNWLTNPSASLEAPQDRRQAYMFSALVLVLLIASILIEITTFSLYPQVSRDLYFQIALAASAIFTGLYFLSRTRFYKWGIAGAIIFSTLLIFTIAITNKPQFQLGFLIYLAIPLLFAGVFFPYQVSGVLAAIYLISLLFIPTFFPNVQIKDVILEPVPVIVLIASSIHLISYNRTQQESDRLRTKGEQEERYRLLAESTYEGICVHINNRIVDANPGLARIFGYESDEIIGMSIWDFITAEKKAQIEASPEFKTTPRDPLIGICKDGSTIEIEVAGKRQHYHGQIAEILGVRNVTERNRAIRALERKTDQQKHLIETAKHLTESLKINEVLRRIGSGLMEILGSDGCAVYILEPDEKSLMPVACIQPKFEAAFYATSLDVDVSFTGRVVKTKRGIIINDTLSHDGGQHIEGTPKEDNECLLIVPFIIDGEVHGAMTMNRFSRHFQEEDLALAETFAAYASSAIKNAEALENLRYEIEERKRAENRTKQHLERLSGLREIDHAISNTLNIEVILKVLLEQVTKQLNVDAADVLLIRSYTNVLEWISGRGFQTESAKNVNIRLGVGEIGRAILDQQRIDLAALTTETGESTRDGSFEDEGFVVHLAQPLLAKGQFKGLLEIFHRKPISPDKEWFDYLETLAGQTAIAVDNTQLFERLQQSHNMLMLSYDATLAGWAKALEFRDQETVGHSNRVTELTTKLAQKMGVHEGELVHIRHGALLHDIGKMGIPDHILHKPGPLNDAEWEIMKQHPIYAFEMLSPIDFLRPALHIPYCHHEKWDGSGYPRGLKGTEIPLAARIFAIIDVWDALLSDRPYRRQWTQESAVEHILEQRGKHFDPDVVDAFMDFLYEEGKLNQPVLAG